jgi:aarF domain-containing kinase
MRPLQDQCYPTPYEDIEKLFIVDMGKPISDLFDDFNPEPLGVASLAQVHSATDKRTGRKVAVKLQHPHLQEFCDVDMKMVELSLGLSCSALRYLRHG